MTVNAAAVKRKRPATWLENRAGTVTYLFLGVYSLIAVGPLLLVLINSFRTTLDISQSPLGLPTSFYFDNYVKAWNQASFGTFALNSVLVTTVSILLGVAAAAFAAFPLARWRFRGRGTLSALFLAGLLLPAQLGIVPIFTLLDSFGLVDSYLGLILVYSTLSLPLAILILTTFFKQLPENIEEAARIDGAGEIRVFFSIMLPLIRPALATVAIVQAAPIWNDFFYPLVLLRSSEKYTLPVGLTQFFGQYQSDFGVLFAALVIVSLPLIVIFVFATRQIVAGLTAGSEK
ncbi:carbohydrate ABC transporter permease [Leifsonia sp. AG29]|uniref:carbohydrate ABC transporter permease n=1 Tax=Leifsonia sp. AG29 TaxID=2598860 RepID=UPI00131DF74E|nr:carbohydrate ABC transporter permease [Leifsonia sp. AG29]